MKNKVVTSDISRKIIEPYDPNKVTYYWHVDDILVVSNTYRALGCMCVPNGQKNKWLHL